ncbi:transglutaminase domain-containing protein [Celeribacter arenosi]|uniref:Transglutaminase family protein n=1 Tax=Celeribacter arenosi TaxID=792649 RepID=A0ABP7JT40_9RHOB
MQIQIDVAMDYALGVDPLVNLAIEVARTDGQDVISDTIAIDYCTVTRVAGEGGLGTRIWADVTSPRMVLRYQATVDVTREVSALDTLAADPRQELPGDVLSFLRPSRLIESHSFLGFVERRFGHLSGGAKIAAMRDWIEAEMEYLPGSSNATTSAIDSFASRQGVCRDYAQLMCAFARAVGIPARCVSVYGLGVDPQDFHAVAQVWLSGGWHLVDPTGMARPDHMAVIAVGRDAGDIAFMETETPADLYYQSVSVMSVA